MNRNLIAFLLVPLAGLFLLFHYATFQPALGQGDHGRDLYAFAQTLNGQIPYQDYWWVYGPLMPYYYALFFKMFGIAIPSILVGKIFITILSGTLIFFALSRLIPILFAFMAALWFWSFQPDFYFTYNHIGGITCMLALTLCLFSYISQPRTKYLYIGLFFVFLTALIKINFGLVNLFVLIIFYRTYDYFYRIPMTSGKKKLTQISLMLVPLLIFGVYYFFLFGLTFEEIRQCMPYLPGDQPYQSTLTRTFYSMGRAIILNAFTTTPNTVFAILTISTTLLSLSKIFSSKTPINERKHTATAILLLILLYLLNQHEYLMSGVLYRSYWATPFSSMLLFLMIGYGIKDISPRLQKILFGAFFVIIFLRFVGEVQEIQNKKIPEQFLALPRGHIISGNSPEWFATVEKTTEFLNNKIPANEKFLALPYDPLYYYLTDKQSPTRQLIFFEHIKIPREQEATIIKELEDNKINWVLISSRAWSFERGLGVLGQTYCPLIGKYLEDNFSPVAEFGQWIQPVGWSVNHGTKIYKRKIPR